MEAKQLRGRLRVTAAESPSAPTTVVLKTQPQTWIEKEHFDLLFLQIDLILST